MRPKIMGILNVTPDSFSDGGAFSDPGKAMEQGLRMAAQGADLIDIGGESSRPGAEPVSEEEELSRVIPVIQAIRSQMGTPISIDTTKSRVAARAMESGANLINDISAGRFDAEMFSVATRYRAPIVLMHMRGAPQTMQENPAYDDVVAEVEQYLCERVAAAVAAGIPKSDILLDPGIGFGKRPEDNVTLLQHLDRLVALGHRVLLGASRKSFIGHLTGASSDKRLPGSLAAIALGLKAGVRIFRVHDVAETKQFLSVMIS